LRKMPRDYSKLIGRIVEKFGTRSAFADAMGLKYEALSRRLNNKADFRTEEYIRACELLDISPKEIYSYFFTPKLR
jgi:hypothetical protein